MVVDHWPTSNLAWVSSVALLNPQKAVGSVHSVLGSGALSGEFGDEILAEKVRIEITEWIDPIP